ncbi:KAP family P-loop NTPase fold protein [Gimesia chilikensis]|uniref:KAP family P-loop NTPase fold protein n=1 Tax=Gimesia chilikensis TaxID=2605989 RepID=UPI003A917341
MTLEITTFDEDLLELSEFADRLEKFIEVEQNFVQGSLVLALNSKFGFGKTTFLNMWKNKLDRSDDDGKPLVISLSAWESDYFGDPLFAIISSLVDSLEDHQQSADSLINAAKDFGWFAAALSGQVARKFTGIDPVEAGELAEKKKEQREGSKSLPADAFSIFQGRKEAMIRLKQSIKDFVSDSGVRVLFLVDELDRCRPDYAISYLETIKHIFDVHGAVFILAADREQLENSAKTAFGPDLDFEEYYRKFIHREVMLPPISESGYYELSKHYINYFLERENLRVCYLDFNSDRFENLVEFVGALRLTPRQIQEVFRILGHVLETSDENKGKLLWCLGVGSIAMAALKVSNSRIFQLVGTQQLDPQQALDFLTGLSGKIYIEWWFKLFLTGGGLKMAEGESTLDVMRRVGLTKGDEEFSLLNNLGSWETGWGHSGAGRFIQIHSKIQQISQWK